MWDGVAAESDIPADDAGNAHRPSALDPSQEALSGLGVTIVASSPVTRLGLEALLSDLDIVAQVRTADSVDRAAHVLNSEPPDFLVISTDVAGDDAAMLAGMAQRIKVKVLLILRDDSADTLRRTPSLLANAYLPEQEVSSGRLREILLRTVEGHVFLPGSLAKGLIDQACERSAAPPVPRSRTVLSKREAETLALLADGMSNKQIATRLGISEHGAKRRVANLLARLNCPNRTLAVALAVREGLCGG